ncbi:hypothetical protein C8R46DRAFT_1040925 [Mycena filopes]|nr:hypothetical protein C8R46DRAFT_1040925 [Mycena filopes]
MQSKPPRTLELNFELRPIELNVKHPNEHGTWIVKAITESGSTADPPIDEALELSWRYTPAEPNQTAGAGSGVKHRPWQLLVNVTSGRRLHALSVEIDESETSLTIYHTDELEDKRRLKVDWTNGLLKCLVDDMSDDIEHRIGFFPLQGKGKVGYNILGGRLGDIPLGSIACDKSGRWKAMMTTFKFQCHDHQVELQDRWTSLISAFLIHLIVGRSQGQPALVRV